MQETYSDSRHSILSVSCILIYPYQPDVTVLVSVQIYKLFLYLHTVIVYFYSYLTL